MRRVVQTLATPDDEIDLRVDLIELRLDLYPGVDCSQFSKPFIATVRRVRDGGQFDGTAAERRALFARARGAAYFDLEVGSAPVDVPEGTAVLRSVHNFVDMGGPEALSDPAIEKLVLTPSDATEALSLLGRGIGLGAPFTRFLAPWIYCARTAVAPGMPTPEEVFDLYDVRRLSENPKIFGVVGDPIAHSQSPRIHNAAFRRDGLDAIYLPFRARELAPFWAAFPGEALSVTAPLKEQAAALATDPDDDVRACGAANTLLRDGRAMNTDLCALLELVPEGRGSALVVGAGGVARAAVVALERLGYDVAVWARRQERAALLGRPATSLTAADVVINTTPLEVERGGFHVELVYADGRHASSESADVSAEAFLLAQARHQYRIFTDGGAL